MKNKNAYSEDIISDIEVYESDMSMAISIIARCSENLAVIKSKILANGEPIDKATPSNDVTQPKKKSPKVQEEVSIVEKKSIVIPPMEGKPEGKPIDMVIMEGGKLIQTIDDCDFTYSGTDVSINMGGYTLKKSLAELKEIYDALPERATRKDFDNKRASAALMRYFTFSGDYNGRMLELKGQHVLVKV